jgi:translocation and assembly module TamB
MSDAANANASSPMSPKPRMRKALWQAAAAIALSAIALVGAAVWYAGTTQFENLVRGKVVAQLEQMTGGRVELGAFHWRLLHLEFTADNLTIHGLEAPGQIPYAHIDRLYVRLKVISFFQHEIGLDYFEADRPVIHLIVYPNGTTNQPRPVSREIRQKPTLDTIFDLKINRADLRDGLMIVNERRIPFNAAANHVGVNLGYQWAMGLRGRERYVGTLHMEDLTLERGKAAMEHTVVNAQIELERNQATLRSLTMQSGKQQLALSGSLVNFSDPAWKFQAKGSFELADVEALSEIPGLSVGRVELELQGNGQGTSFTVDGKSRISGAAYHAGTIHLTGVDAATRLHITQDELALNDMQARLAEGGYVEGEMRVTHWLQGAPAKTANGPAKKPEVERGMIRAQLHRIPLAAIMAVVAPPHYTDLGFDTEAEGSATVDWTGSADKFVTGAKVTLMPPVKPTAGRVPMYGAVDAQYSNSTGSVAIRSLDVYTPSSRVQVTGSLGVYPITRASHLQVAMTTANLAEFDRTLTTLGVVFDGKTGVRALPVGLRGKMDFAGTLTDSILSPDVKGHLQATDLNLNFSNPWEQPVAAKAGTAGAATEYSIHLDSVAGDAEYSERRIAVTQAVLTHGSAVIHISGELDAHAVTARHYAFDGQSAIRADVSMQDASLEDLSAVLGKALPATGTVNLQAHTGGVLDDLNGGGHLSVKGGTIYGEPYTSLNTDVQFAGREVDAANLVFIEDGGRITGSGGYNLKTEAYHFNARGSGFELARIKRLQSSKYSLAGNLAFDAKGNGTLHSPSVQANLHLTKVNLDNALTGTIEVEAHTQDRVLMMKMRADLSNAQVTANAQTRLEGDFPTQAQLTLTNLNVDPILSALKVQEVKMHSSIGATVQVSGPLREPRKLNGDIRVEQMALSLAGVPLKSDGAIHATLMDGILHLDELHVTGEDTNMRAHGSIGVLTQAHDLNLQANGSVNMKLVETLDDDLTGAGHVDFNVEANGTFEHPGLTGNVKFTNVSVSLLDFPNGLSQMNGTLEFDQDRLDVKNLTAVSGGGKLTLGGFLTYQQGLYGNLTATAKDVRIRYPQGVSSMANAQLRLQGTSRSLLLSGNVMITRFAVGSGLDLTAFTSSAGNVALPPNMNTPSNRIRLNIHVLSAPQLDFQNSFAKLAGDVNVRVRGTLAQPTVLGHISITEGSATFAGTKYELQHGDIYFSNPIRIDPTIDLSATARVEDYDITVGLTGTASNPVPTFRSEPPLSEQDIFSLLALGRTQEEQQIYTNMQSQAGVNTQADALLGGALNATVSSRVQRLFGGGSVKIDPTFVSGAGNATARITVEQQISKSATLTYATNVNSTAEQLIQGQINLTKNLSIVAVRDEAGVFSLIFKVRRRYQ